jgi:hypothetical protein
MNVEIDGTARGMASKVLTHVQLLILEGINILFVVQRGVEWGCYNSNFRFYCITEHRILHCVMRDRLFCDGAWRMAAFRGVRTVENRDYQLRHVCLSVRTGNSALPVRIFMKSDI